MSIPTKAMIKNSAGIADFYAIFRQNKNANDNVKYSEKTRRSRVQVAKLTVKNFACRVSLVKTR